MHRLLRSTLIANTTVMAFLLVSNWAFAEPLPAPVPQPLSETVEHGMLDTSTPHSQYLYQARLHPNVAASDERSIAQIWPSQWITTPQAPAQRAKPPTPGLRF